MAERYARLYHRFGREFPAIYSDDHTLATWCRLLMLADASWPLRPPLPRSARKATVDQLVSAGLVFTDGDSYGIRGLDAERTRRSDAGRNAAALRWQSEGNAGASGTGMLSRAEHKQEQRVNGAVDKAAHARTHRPGEPS